MAEPSTEAVTDAADDEAMREARRALLLALAAWMALVVGIGVATIAVRTSDSNADPSIVGVPGAASSIGPPAGAAVEPYLRDRKAALADATGTRVAVVSLTSYRTEPDARRILADADPQQRLQIIGLLVAVPGDAPAVVRSSLADFIARERPSLQQQHDDVAQLLATVGPDKAYAQFYARELDRLTKALAALDPNGDIVFGAVVTGSADALRALGSDARVRLVDVGDDELRDAPDRSYAGLLPDEVATVGSPQQQRPAPPG